jgi:uncharacterized membrane protein YhiD involved in acid resistance
MRLSSPHRPHGSHVAGNSLVPVLIIVAALGISAAIFFLFTKKKMEAGKAAEMAEASAKAGEEPAKDAAATPANSLKQIRLKDSAGEDGAADAKLSRSAPDSKKKDKKNHVSQHASSKAASKAISIYLSINRYR